MSCMRRGQEIVDEVIRGTDGFNSEVIGGGWMLGAGGAEHAEGDKIAQRIKSLPPVAYNMLDGSDCDFQCYQALTIYTLMNFKNVLIQATPLMIVAFGHLSYRPDAGNRPVSLWCAGQLCKSVFTCMDGPEGESSFQLQCC